MRKFALLVPLILFIWFCGGDVLSHIVSISIDVLIGYYVLFLLCQRIMEKRSFTNFDEMLKEFNITGVVRVILTSFQDFGEIFNIRPYIANAMKILAIKSQTKNNKPYIKVDYNEDVETIQKALLQLIRNKSCYKGITYKDIVEQNFSDKWGYFYHTKYVEKILTAINKQCMENHLPLLGIIVIYANKQLTECFLEYITNNNIKINGIDKNSKIGDEKVKQYIDEICNNIDKYSKIFAGKNDNALSNKTNKKTKRKKVLK